jgi:hypothetical protein
LPCSSTRRRAIPMACSCCRTSRLGRSLVNGRSKTKAPILTLTPEQERERSTRSSASWKTASSSTWVVRGGRSP